MTRLKTLAPGNEFRFACPVFGAEVAISGCLELRERVWRGERVAERRGCVACMRASKCPIPRILTVMQRSDDDPYHAAAPTVGRLRPEIIEHISPIVVPGHILDQEQVPPSERDLIVAANEAAGPKKSKGAAPAPIAIAELAPRAGRAKAKVEPDADEKAAAAGDMSAAISKAALMSKQVPSRTPTTEQPASVREATAKHTMPYGGFDREKSPGKPAGGDAPAKVKSSQPNPPTPPTANVAKPDRPDFANSPRKSPSLLELARQRRAAGPA